MNSVRSAIVTKSRQKNYDMVQFHVPKGQREKIKAHAEKQGLSMNAYILQLINKDMGSDN